MHRCAHLAPNHLTEHRRQIDAIPSSRVPNLPPREKFESEERLITR
ncbi:hypothetical protein C7428_0280 [Pantoea ananatis]|nr:hypothetical protein C7428_0280 [Pantoea ananatis]